MSNYNVIFSNELYHHGIKGMKWGIRRFQNEDGTLTAEGRKRYEKTIDSVSRKYRKAKVGTYEQSVELDKMYKKLGKIGADILKNNENSEDVKSIRAKSKRMWELVNDAHAKLNEAVNSKAGQKEIDATIKYYKDKEGYTVGRIYAQEDLIGNPKNPYHKSSTIVKKYMKAIDAASAARKDYENAVESYISKLTGSTDYDHIRRGQDAIDKALADEQTRLERKNRK